MKQLISLTTVALVLILSGCVMNQVTQRLQSDRGLQSAALLLTRDYLEGQQQGESGQEALRKYGTTRTFYNLIDYRLQNYGEKFGQPAFFVSVKAGSEYGVIIWRDYHFVFDYDQKLETSGDKYLGLRIYSAGED